MNWLFLTFVSVVFRAVYGVMTKILSDRVKTSVYTQVVLLSVCGALLGLIMSPFLGGLHFNFAGISIVSIILLMLGQGLGNIAYFSGIKNLTNGTTQIAFSSILLFNTVLSLIFLNLHLTFLNLFGLVLLLLAVVSVVTGKIELHKKGVALIVLSALLFSVFQLSSSSISKHIGAAMYIIIAYLGSVIIIMVYKGKVVLSDLASAKKRITLVVTALTALPSFAYYLFSYYAYRQAPTPAKVAMLLTSQVVLTVFLSYFFLKEKGHVVRKVAAAALVLVSAVLIKN